MFAAWLLAAGAVAVTVAVVVVEILVVIGLIDRSGSGYGLWLNVATGAAFVVLAAIPFVFKTRFRPEAGRAAGQS